MVPCEQPRRGGGHALLGAAGKCLHICVWPVNTDTNGGSGCPHLARAEMRRVLFMTAVVEGLGARLLSTSSLFAV